MKTLKVLDKYILKEVSGLFFQSLVVLTFVMLLNQVMQITELVLNRGLGFLSVMKIFLLVIPPLLVFTVPISLLIASVVSFARLSSDNEITAMKSCGISFVRATYALIGFAVFITILDFFISVRVHPWSGVSLKTLGKGIVKGEQGMLKLEEGRFNILGGNLMIYIENVPSITKLEGIFISDARNPESERVIFAKRGRLINIGKGAAFGLKLENGSIQSSSLEEKTESITFSSYEFQIRSEDIIEKNSITPSELRPEEMSALLKKEERPAERKKILRSMQNYYKNFSYPFICLIFPLIGAPLGLFNRRSGKSGGFAVSILVVLFFYFLDGVATSAVSSEFIRPLGGAVLPVVILAVAALISGFKKVLD